MQVAQAEQAGAERPVRLRHRWQYRQPKKRPQKLDQAHPTPVAVNEKRRQFQDLVATPPLQPPDADVEAAE